MRRFCATAAVAALALAAMAAAVRSGRPPMPEFQVENWISEKTVSWDDLQGSPFVAEFWATWCPPCRRSIPHLNELNRLFEPLGVPLVALTTEQTEQEPMIREFAEEYRMNYYVGFDPGLSRELGVRGIPYAVVVDHEGRIAWRGNPLMPEFEEELHEATAEWLFPEEQFPETRSHAAQTLREKSGEGIAKLQEMDDDEEAQRALKVLNETAEKMAKGLDSMAEEEDPAKHVLALQDLAKRFAGLPAAEAAKEKAEKALENEAVAADVGLLSGLREAQDKLERRLQETLEGIEDRNEAMRLAIPLFEETIQDLDALLQRYPDAKHAETVSEEQAQMQQALESFRQQIEQE